jgi:GAF domain-containing protein
LIRPSSSSKVRDALSSNPGVAVLNLTSLDGRAEQVLEFLPETTVVACSDRESGKELLGSRPGIIAAGSEEEIIETIQLVLEKEALAKELRDRRRQVSQLKTQSRGLRKEIADLRAIGEITRSISSTLLIEEILKGILKGIRQVLSLDRVLLGLVNSETNEEELKVAVGIGGQEFQGNSWKIGDEDPVWERLRIEAVPLILDRKSCPGLPPLLRKTFQKKFIKAPMVVKGQIIGTIMGDRTASRFTKRELRLLQIFVEYAGIAIENGRLYYEVITSQEELKRTQRQLVGAERLAVIGQLAVSINHEINNPLCNISLITQTLKARLSEQAPELVERLQGIEQNIERIRQVTQQVSEIKDAKATEYLPDQLMINLK